MPRESATVRSLPRRIWDEVSLPTFSSRVPLAVHFCCVRVLREVASPPALDGPLDVRAPGQLDLEIQRRLAAMAAERKELELALHSQTHALQQMVRARERGRCTASAIQSAI